MEQVVAERFSPSFESGVADRESGMETGSGVSWPAVIGGGLVSASISLILLALGTGLGLSSVSVWSNAGVTASTLGAAGIVWLIVMQIMSSSLGGYLAGRLRTKWTRIHSDEVYFRDTAHGFLSWSLAVVVSAAFLTSAAGSMLGAASSSASGGTRASSVETTAGTSAYFVDALLRSDSTGPDSEQIRAEIGRIFATSLHQGRLSLADQTYLNQITMRRTGMSQTDAEKRVSEDFVGAQQAMETARKNTAHLLLWSFLALLIGAFCASVAATIGGKQRDHVAVVK